MQNDYHQPQRDPELWALAKRRASFRYHLTSYLVVNGCLWALWYFTTPAYDMRRLTPWPFFPTLGWGIGLLFHYLGAFVFPRHDAVENEYRKLLDQRNIQQPNKH